MLLLKTLICPTIEANQISNSYRDIQLSDILNFVFLWLRSFFHTGFIKSYDVNDLSLRANELEAQAVQSFDKFVKNSE